MRHTITGIDFGTHAIKVVICEQLENSQTLKIVGAGVAPSRGIKSGYIMNTAEAAESLRMAVHQAEAEANTRVTHAYVAVGGIGIDELRTSSEMQLGKQPRLVTEEDMQRVSSQARLKAEQLVSNKRIIHEIPLSMTLDGQQTLGSVVGQKGKVLSAEMLFVFAHEQHIEKLIEATEDANIEVIDVMAAPLAASLVLLNKMQKTAGSALVLLGSDTTSIAVFDEGLPVSVKILPLGSAHITNEIALGLKITLEEAERLKKNYHTQLTHPRKKVTGMVEKKVRDVLKLVMQHLKTVPHGDILPAGVYLSGGGAYLHQIVDFTKSTLRLPAAHAQTRGGNARSSSKEMLLAVAYGMCVFGYEQEREQVPAISLGSLTSSLGRWIKQFLP
jgi:cell division protein FtsA